MKDDPISEGSPRKRWNGRAHKDVRVCCASAEVYVTCMHAYAHVYTFAAHIHIYTHTPPTCVAHESAWKKEGCGQEDDGRESRWRRSSILHKVRWEISINRFRHGLSIGASCIVATSVVIRGKCSLKNEPEGLCVETSGPRRLYFVWPEIYCNRWEKYKYFQNNWKISLRDLTIFTTLSEIIIVA